MLPRILVGVAGSRTALAPPGSLSDGSAELESRSALEHPEVRDVIAWLRLLLDPHDAAAVVRALARPPIELRQVELARIIQVARRRKLGLVPGLGAAIESPQVPPEARERIQRFLSLHARIAADFAAEAPDVFLARLIQRLRPGGRALLGGLEELQRLAGEFRQAEPYAGPADLARHLTLAGFAGSRESQTSENDMGLSHDDSDCAGSDLPSGDSERIDQHELDRDASDRELRKTLQLLREELLDGIERIGGRLSELRLDTELDVAHGIVRYLELLRVSALLQRPADQSLDDALADVNVRLLAATTPLQREILQTSALDHTRPQPPALLPREQHSLRPFLPHRGVGLALSASDIHTYRACPLRYKYARVLRIPVEQTLGQRFGIVVHQVLERYHLESGHTLAHLLQLLDGCWRRAGFGEDDLARELRTKAVTALTRYHARLRQAHGSQPVWFERRFDFRLGPHHVRGRVDRVDRLGPEADADYELIDYKTSRPKSPQQLREDVQLSLYALAAREDWGLKSTRQSYYYVLDDLIVPLAGDGYDIESMRDVVMKVGDGILGERFEPTPSPDVCAMCDYRITCPSVAS